MYKNQLGHKTKLPLLYLGLPTLQKDQANYNIYCLNCPTRHIGQGVEINEKQLKAQQIHIVVVTLLSNTPHLEGQITQKT